MTPDPRLKGPGFLFEAQRFAEEPIFPVVSSRVIPQRPHPLSRRLGHILNRSLPFKEATRLDL